MKRQLTPFAKLIIIAIIVAGIYFVLQWANKNGMANKIASTGKPNISLGNFGKGKHDSNEIRVGVVTWGGYAGGQYFNGGFEASEESRYFKDYGIKVKFVVNDDAESARKAFENGEVDVLEVSVDSFMTDYDKIGTYNPKMIFLSDWSRGGDAIVAKGDINSVNDLYGKKVAVALGSCSHTLLIWILNSAGINYMDVNIVAVKSTENAAEEFIAGNVDAAVVWSPDDEKCLNSVSNSKILINTKNASNIIADAFMTKQSYLDSHKSQLKSLIEGWMIGASEINSDDGKKLVAARILAKGYNDTEESMMKAINNARLVTLGDNKNFWGLNENYKGITGQDIYKKGSENFKKLNVFTSPIADFQNVYDASIVDSITLSGDGNSAEGMAKYSKVKEEDKNIQAVSTKKISINFNSGSYVLDENSKTIIDLQLADIARAFGNMRIRIEGNTDSIGDRALNEKLSLKRAQAVADYLTEKYEFDSNRFIVVGNGDSKPVAGNDTEEGRGKNRRTDFELIK